MIASSWKAVSKALVPWALIVLGACSTIVSGSDQSITVVTEPDGAKCLLLRDGETVGAVGLTPGSSVVTKSKNDLTITCEREGFGKTSEIVESGDAGWTAGNIAFGLLLGGAGLIVDSASGAMHNYPETIRLALVPEKFATDADRDQFFDARVADLDSKFSAAREQFETSCANKSSELCDIKRKDVESAYEKRRSTIELQRREARVAP